MADSKKTGGSKVVQERLAQAERDGSPVVALSSLRLAKFPEALIKKKALQSIQELDLSNNMVPSIPAKIFRLSSLQVLRMGRNLLMELPTELCSLPSLTELYLEDNQISVIPKAVENLKNLRYLNITNNRVSQLPTELGLLNSLKRIDLSGNPLPAFHEKLFVAYARQPSTLNLHGMGLEAVPEGVGLLKDCLTNLYMNANSISCLGAEIFQLQYLEELDLRKNRITIIPDIVSQLSSLEVLILSSNRLTHLPDSFSSLRNLRHLALSENQLTAFPPPLLGMPALEELFLAGNSPGLTSIPPGITALQNLTLLFLKDNRLQEITWSLKDMRSLKKISLAGNPIADVSVETFMACTTLADLDLSGTHLPVVQQKMIESAVQRSSVLDVSDVQVETLQDELVHFKDIITNLCFCNNQVVAMPLVILELHKLQHLDMSFNDISDLPEGFASSLASLERLVLHHNKIPELPSVVLSLPDLRFLDLSFNSLKAIGGDFSTLSSLRQLFLKGNAITEISQDVLSLTSLEVLDLTSNQIEILPPEIGNLLLLQELYLDSNLISEIPLSITNLQELSTFRVTNNKLESVPQQLLDMNILLLSVGGNQLSPLLTELFNLYTTRAGALDLSYKLVDGGVPPQVFKLAFIQELCLANNQLTTLPDELADISMLSLLDVSHNELSDFPPAIRDMRLLRTLDVGHNKFTDIPWNVLLCPKLSVVRFNHNLIAEMDSDAVANQLQCPLEELDLSFNKLVSLPIGLFAIQSLKKIVIEGNHGLSNIFRALTAPHNMASANELSLAHMNLNFIPEEVLCQVQLTSLDLSGNCFTTLPAELARLSQLTRLDISTTVLTDFENLELNVGLKELRASNCGVRHLPKEVYQLPSLERLILSFNEIEELPEDLSRLNALRELHVANNLLQGLPTNMPAFQVLNVRRNPFNSHAGTASRAGTTGWAEDLPTLRGRASTNLGLSKSSPNVPNVPSAKDEIMTSSAPSTAPGLLRPTTPERSVNYSSSSAPIDIVLPESAEAASTASSYPDEKQASKKSNRKFSSGWKKLSKRARTWTDLKERPKQDTKRNQRMMTTMSPPSRPAFGTIPKRPSGLTVLVSLTEGGVDLTPIVLEVKTYEKLLERVIEGLSISEPIKALEVMASPSWVLDSDRGVRNLEQHDIIVVRL